MIGSEFTSSTDWPESCMELRQIDSLMRCSICFDFMTTAMVIPKCSHNYCSLCIRSYISSGHSKCPACNGQVAEVDLRNNRVVDEIIKNFTSIRSTLLNTMKSQSATKPPDVSQSTQKPQGVSAWCVKKTKTITPAIESDRPDVTDTKDTVIPTKRKNQSGRKRRIIESDSDYEVQEISSGNESDEDFMETSTTQSTKKANRGRKFPILSTKKSSSASSTLSNVKSGTGQKSVDLAAKRAFLFDKPNTCSNDDSTTVKAASRQETCDKIPTTPVKSPLFSSPTKSAKPSTSFQTPQPGTSKQTGTTPGPSYGRVDCPVCGVSIPERNVNLHLDMCLTSSEKKESLRSKVPKRKPLPKLVYNLLKDGDLRKKLQSVGLPTNGDRKALIKRHHDYTIMYNAECDSENPKSAADIAKEVMKNEQTKAKLGNTTAEQGKLNIQKGATEEEVDKAQKSYAKEHKDHFASLISDMKKRMKNKKATAKEKNKEQGSECVVIDETSTDTGIGTIDASSRSESVPSVNSGRSPVDSSSAYFTSRPTSSREGGDKNIREADAVKDDAVGLTSFPSPLRDAINVTRTTELLEVPPAPQFPPQLGVFDESTDEEENTQCGGTDPPTALVKDSPMHGPENPEQDSQNLEIDLYDDSGPESPSILADVPLTQGWRTSQHIVTEDTDTVMETPKKSIKGASEIDGDATPRNSQKSTASSYFPLGQVAPSSPISTVSSAQSAFGDNLEFMERTHLEAKESSALIADDLILNDDDDFALSGKSSSSRRGKGRGKGKKRTSSVLEESDSSSTKRVKTQSPLPDDFFEDSQTVRRSSRQRRKPKT